MNQICKTEPANINEPILQQQNEDLYNNEYVKRMISKDSCSFEEEQHLKNQKEFDRICRQSILKILAKDKQDLQQQISNKIQYMKNKNIQEQHKKNLNSKVYSIIYGTLSQFDDKKSPSSSSRKVSNPIEKQVNNEKKDKQTQKQQTISTQQTLKKKQESESSQFPLIQNRNQILLQQLLEKQNRQKRSASQNDNDCNQSFEYKLNNKYPHYQYQLNKKWEQNSNTSNNFKDSNQSIVFNDKQQSLNIGDNDYSFKLGSNVNLNQSLNIHEGNKSSDKLIQAQLKQNDEYYIDENQTIRNSNNKKYQQNRAYYNVQMNPYKFQRNSQTINKQKNVTQIVDNCYQLNKQLSLILQKSRENLNEKSNSYTVQLEQNNISQDNSRSNRNLRNSFSYNDINCQSSIQTQNIHYDIPKNSSARNGSANNSDNRNGFSSRKQLPLSKCYTEQLMSEYIEGEFPLQIQMQQRKKIQEDKSLSRQNELPILQQFEQQQQFKYVKIKFEKKQKNSKLFSRDQGQNSSTLERIDKQNLGNNISSNQQSPNDKNPSESDKQKGIISCNLYPLQESELQVTRNQEQLNNSNKILLNNNRDSNFQNRLQVYRSSEALPFIEAQSPKQRASPFKKVFKSIKRDGSRSPHIDLARFQQAQSQNSEQIKDIYTKQGKENILTTPSQELENRESQIQIQQKEIYNFDGITNQSQQKHSLKIIQTNAYNKYVLNNIERAKAKSDHIQAKHISNYPKIDQNQNTLERNLQNQDRSLIKTQNSPQEQNLINEENINIERLDKNQLYHNYTVLKYQKDEYQQNQYQEQNSKDFVNNVLDKKDNLHQNKQVQNCQDPQVLNKNVDELQSKNNQNKEIEQRQQFQNQIRVSFRKSAQNNSSNRIRKSSSSQRISDKLIDQKPQNQEDDYNNITIVKLNLKERQKINKNQNINDSQSNINQSKYKILDNNIQQLPKQNENILQQLQNIQYNQESNIKPINTDHSLGKIERTNKKDDQLKNISQDNLFDYSKQPSIEVRIKQDNSEQLESYYKNKYSNQIKNRNPDKQLIKIKTNKDNKPQTKNTKQDFSSDFSNLDPWEIDLCQDNYLFQYEQQNIDE